MKRRMTVGALMKKLQKLVDQGHARARIAIGRDTFEELDNTSVNCMNAINIELVDYHKTTRSGEVMLKMLFRRYKALLTEADTQVGKEAIVPNAPPDVCRAFSASIALDQYLMLDDHTMTEFAKACLRCGDLVMSTLARGLLERKLFKAVDVTDAGSPNVAKFYEKAKDIVATKSGLPVEFFFDSDTPSDTAYKLYNPDASKPATQIYVHSADGKQHELSRLSENVANLTKPYKLIRYYFPENVQELIRSEAVPLLFKE